MPRKRYRSDDERLRVEPHIRVFHSIRHGPPAKHARWGEVFQDPLLRGVWLGLMLAADQAAPDGTDGRRVLTATDIFSATARRRSGRALAERVLEMMGYEVGTSALPGGIEIVDMENPLANRGWASAKRGAGRGALRAEPWSAESGPIRGVRDENHEQNHEHDSALRGGLRAEFEPDQRSGFWLKEPEPLVLGEVQAEPQRTPLEPAWKRTADAVQARMLEQEQQAGSSMRTGPASARERKQALRRPTLRDLQMEDLQDCRRFLACYREAVKAKLAEDTPDGRIDFFARREQALRVGDNKVALFMSNLLKQRKHWSPEDRSEAARTLRDLDYSLRGVVLPDELEQAIGQLGGKR